MNHLVVAHYKENLDWLKTVSGYAVHVYHKSPEHAFTDPSWSHTQLPNKGRESHTYLYHLVEHYNNLPPWVFFTQGDPHGHCAYYSKILALEIDDIKSMISFKNPSHIILPKEHFFGIGYAYEYDSKKLIGWDIVLESLSKVYDLIGLPMPKQFQHSVGALLGVSKTAIHRYPISFYKQLLEMHKNYEGMPWAMELSWHTIFYEKNNFPTPVFL